MNALASLLEARLRSQLAEFPYRRLFVGFSGGLDSTVLLHVARALEAGVTALHVNHGLQPEADGWEARCAGYCRRLGARFVSGRADVAGGSEAAAREARYAVFDDVLEVDDLLLLGHHRDDQAETVLLRLVQGRAPLGMPRTRRLQCGARILRPWLATAGEDLLRHAREAELDWIEDPANASADFDRNFLRHEILPKLAGRWPGVAKVLAAGAETQRARDRLLGHLAGSGAGALQSVDTAGGATPADPSVHRHRALNLEGFPRDLKVEALRLWLHGLGEFAAGDRALAEFVRQLSAPADAHPRLPLQRGVLRRHGGNAVYTPREFELLAGYRLDLPGVLALPHGELAAEPHPAGFHATGALQIRFRSGGERLRCGGKTRSVKKLLHAAGIPAWSRRTWPLAYSGGALVAVPGVATADTPDREPRWRLSWRPR